MNDTARASSTLPDLGTRRDRAGRYRAERGRGSHRSARPATAWWIWMLTAIGAVGLLIAAVVVGIVVLPPAIANLRTHVATAADPLVLGAGEASVTIAVPDGWLVTPTDDTHAIVATPDRGMTVEVEVTPGDPAQAAADAGVSSAMVETLASGLTAAHGSPAPTGGQDAESGPVLVAAVGPVAGGSVVFTVSADDLDTYRPALASLLEGVRP